MADTSYGEAALHAMRLLEAKVSGEFDRQVQAMRAVDEADVDRAMLADALAQIAVDAMDLGQMAKVVLLSAASERLEWAHKQDGRVLDGEMNTELGDDDQQP